MISLLLIVTSVMISSCFGGSVKVDFSKVVIRATKGDPGSHEEWKLNHYFYLKIKSDFLSDSWRYCSKTLDAKLSHNGDDCSPPDNRNPLNYVCYFGSTYLDDIYVDENAFNQGFKFSVRFQIGDWDFTDPPKFDNGPEFDIDYTESLTTSSLPRSRTFTRIGPEGRAAKFYVKYEMSPVTVSESDIEYQHCVENVLPFKEPIDMNIKYIGVGLLF
eukprot:UN09625